MMRPMNFRMPTDDAIHTAFEKGEAAIMELFHNVADQMTALAQQLAKQGEVLQALQARLAKSSRNSSKPPSSDGYGKVKRTESLRKSGDKPNGGQPGHDGQTLLAVEHPERTLTHAVPSCAHCQASLHDIEAGGYEKRQGCDITATRMDVTAHRAAVKGQLHWLHVASTAALTHDEVHPKRGHEAMEDASILGAFRGTAVHDHWKPSFTYDTCAHALCNAHHLRERRCIDTQYQQAWANDMAELLLEIKAAVAATPEPAMRLSLSDLTAFEQRYDAVVQAGFEANLTPVPTTEGEEKKRGRPKHPPPVNLLIRLRDFKGQVLAFMADFRVPFDNNQGERDIRMVKVKQKVSGGFRTFEGAQRFGRIRGYLSTARKQAKNVFEAIRDAFDGNPFIPSSEMP